MSEETDSPGSKEAEEELATSRNVVKNALLAWINIIMKDKDNQEFVINVHKKTNK